MVYCDVSKMERSVNESRNDEDQGIRWLFLVFRIFFTSANGSGLGDNGIIVEWYNSGIIII